MNKYTLFLICLGLLIVSVAAVSQVVGTTSAGETQKKNIGVATVTPIGGPFSLVDHNGQDVTDQSYGDRYKMIFFGFTSCPDVCPGELTKIASIMDDLGADADRIQPLFITIDPERDTPEVMKEYVELFHPAIVGLTGTLAQIEEIEETYKVYSAKNIIEGMEEGNYMVDHSGFTYFMSPDNELILVFDGQDEPAQIIEEIRGIL